MQAEFNHCYCYNKCYNSITKAYKTVSLLGNTAANKKLSEQTRPVEPISNHASVALSFSIRLRRNDITIDQLASGGTIAQKTC